MLEAAAQLARHGETAARPLQAAGFMAIGSYIGKPGRMCQTGFGWAVGRHGPVLHGWRQRERAEDCSCSAPRSDYCPATLLTR